ncbi:MAG: FAD-dependent oxidoreductase [Kiritimatiellia bacterium]|nr:FAD-dependent oxidoreductase [Kiritimatiellia bacterium]
MIKRVFQLVVLVTLLMNTGMAGEAMFVDAESFTYKGGWVVDQQFTHVMGSPYLLAHGMGKPVANARTAASFPVTGSYRLWVRTRNWVPGNWEAPGRFKVIVNGTELATVFGTRDGWAWQKGDRVEVKAGKVALELKDLTGFEGRCDALFFTTDESFEPPEDVEKMKLWRDRLKGVPAEPKDAGTFDVVIVGGGISGCAAALAAHEQNLNVALIHDRPLLGGNASSEVRVHTIGIRGKGTDIIKSIDTAHWPNGSAKSLADQYKRTETMTSAENVKLFLSWRAYGANTDGNRIVSVDASQNETGEKARFAAPIFIDCTGDGWVGFWAGAEYRYGRESSDEFGEAWPQKGDLWSPKKADKVTMGTSVLWNSERATRPVSFPEVPWAMDVAGSHAAINGEWYWEYANGELNQIYDAEEIRDHMFRAIYGSFYNAKKNGKNANVALKWVAYVGGKRESRRLMGDYIYTERDILERRRFKDAVVEEKRDVDVHCQIKEMGDDKDFLSKALYRNPRGLYYVPFRCLYSKNVENLMMAGRCFSCSHVALGGPRVMLTCGQMGIATGYAASLCKKHDTTPRGVYQAHIKELREMIGYGDDSDQKPSAGQGLRTSDKYLIEQLPRELKGLALATIRRGMSNGPAPSFSVKVDAKVIAYLAVQDRGGYKPPDEWKKTDMKLRWHGTFTDTIYKRECGPGMVVIPGHNGTNGAYYGIPNALFIKPLKGDAKSLKVSALPEKLGAAVYTP